MKTKTRQSGLTLIETTVVIAIVATLTVLSAPAIRSFLNSMTTSPGGTRALINAALSSARATAAKEQRYAGLRFQKAYHPKGPLEADQYMVFIIYEEPLKMRNITNGFRAVEGMNPIKLPATIGVMDLRINSNVQILFDRIDVGRTLRV